MPNLSDLAGYGRDFLQGASNAAASNISAPVDGLAWLLNKGGMNIQNPVGGSDWMAQQGLTQQPTNRLAGLLGESVGGVTPMLAAAKAPQIAGGLAQMAGNINAPQTLNRQAGVILYHGSNATKNIPKVLDNGQFQGLFASTSQGAAESHGQSLYRMTIPDDAIMKMGHELPEASLYASVEKNMPYKSNPEDVKQVADMVGSGRGLDSLDGKEAARLASVIDPLDGLAGADWALQRMRGQAAKDHGFRAVEMPDEHGVSHLVLPGEKLRPANDQSRLLARGLESNFYAPPAPTTPMYGSGIDFDSWLKLDDAARKSAMPNVKLRRGMRPNELALFESYR